MDIYFDIYTNLLTGAGMSCLVHNRWNNRYALLLEALSPYSTDAPGTFFRKLNAWMNKNGVEVVPDVAAELNLMAIDSSKTPCKYLAAFKAFPAVNPAVRFYTLIIMFCLEGYERILNMVNYDSKKRLTALSKHARLLTCLHRLFCMETSTPAGFSNRTTIVCFVKTAICILYSHLKQKHPDGKFEVYPLTNPRNAMKMMLGEADLEPDTAAAIMKVFDSLAADQPEASQPPDNDLRPETPEQNGMPSDSSDINEIIPEFIKMKQEVDTCKDIITMINSQKEREKGSHQNEKNKLIGCREVMNLLNMSKTTLHRKRKLNEIPYIQIGRKISYRLDEILAYREKHCTKSKDKIMPNSENKYKL